MDTHPVAAAVLTGGRWTETGRALAAKMLAEFLYEELLAAEPAPGVPGAFQVELPAGWPTASGPPGGCSTAGGSRRGRWCAATATARPRPPTRCGCCWICRPPPGSPPPPPPT